MRSIAGLLLLALVAGGCSSSSPDVDDAATSTVPEGGTPDPVLTEFYEWALGVVNGVDLTEAEFETRFDDSFKRQIDFDAFVVASASILGAGPYRELDVTFDEAGRGVRAELAGAHSTTWVLSLQLAADRDVLTGMLISPGSPPSLDDPPATVAAAADRLAEEGTLRYVAAEIVDGECSELAGTASGELAPIGSVFKLYVLAAVADAIAEGSLAWSDELVITDQIKSLPSGELQNRDDGSTATVEEAARLMISISDNTATDLLIETVGRSAVEAAVRSSGHASPEVNEPFLTTREVFLLKAADATTQRRWVEGGTEPRRALLAELAGRSLDDVPLSLFMGGPIAPDTIEWFATPLDLCRVLASLWNRASEAGLGPLRPILTTNPGVPDTGGVWAEVAFKGGSEPGLLATSWLTVDDAGRQFVVTLAVLDAAESLDETSIILLAAALRDLVPTVTSSR